MDLVARLLLDSNQFDRSIQNSKTEVKGFQEQGEKVSGSVRSFTQSLGLNASKIVGWGAVVGVATTVGKAFYDGLNLTQSSADKMDASISGARASLDTLKVSLASLDFSNLLDGLRESFREGKKLSEMLDELATKKLFSDTEYSRLDVEREKQMLIAEDKSKSVETRRAAIAKAKEIEKKQIELSEQLAQQNISTGRQGIRTEFSKHAKGKYTLSDSEIDYLVSESNRADYSKIAVEVTKREKELAERLNSAESVLGKMQRSAKPDTQGIKAQKIAVEQARNDLKAYQDTKEYRRGDKIRIFLQQQDNEQSETYKGAMLIQEGYRMQAAAIRQQSQTIKKENKIEKGAAKEGGKKEEILPRGSIAYAEKQIKELRERLTKATTAEARQTIGADIKAIEESVREMKLEIDYPDAAESGRKAVASKPVELKATIVNALQLRTAIETIIENKQIQIQLALNAGDLERFNKLKRELEELQKRHSSINESYALNVQPLKTGKGGGKEAESAVDKYREAIERARKENEDMIESLGAVGNTFGSLSQIIGGNAGSWLQWGGNVISAIGAAIPAISALVTAKKAEAGANAEAAATGAASAVAGIPFVGPVLAVAAVASVLAALANTPKFADGGIVGGMSYHGDKLIARVNSGEAILNEQQQKTALRLMEARNNIAVEPVIVGGRITMDMNKLVVALEKQGRKNKRT